MRAARLTAAPAVVLALTLVGATASQAQPSAPADAASAADRAAERLMLQGRPAEARAIVERALRSNPEDRQALFLTGLLALDRHDASAAIGAFRKLLARAPGAARVRLELGRAYLMNGDAARAEREFRLATAGELPPNVKANVERYLDASRRARSRSLTLSAAATSDSNINRGTQAEAVQIFGLPFQLSDEARRKSGVGLSAEASGEWRPLLFGRQPARAALQFSRSQYGRSEFNDMTAALEAGPRFLVREVDVTPMAVAFERWVGDHPAMTGAGGRLEASLAPTAATQVIAAASLLATRYIQQPDQSGAIATAELSGFHAFGPAGFARLSLALSRQATRTPALDNTAGDLRIGYWRALPLGVALYAEPSIGASAYDRTLAAFGQRRRDVRFGGRIDLTAQNGGPGALRPRLSLVHARQRSSIALYSYTRNQIELGISSSF